MRVHHKLLKELANCFNLDKNTIETSYGSFRVKPSTIGAALGLNASGDLFLEKVSYKKLSEENKHIFRRFQGTTLKNLTDEMMSIGVENEQDRLMFKKIFILYIQMAFLAQSKKTKQVVEDSSPEQTQSYDGKKGAPLSSTEGHYDSSETLSMVEESANDPAEQNMMVVRVETQSQIEALSIVPIQVYVPLSQITPEPEIEPSPAKSQREKISEERTKSTPQLPKPDESTPTVPPAPSKINPTPGDAAALMMISQTASYIPKEGLMPSLSLGLTDSSQEEAPTQEGQRAKSPETPKIIEQLKELVEKITNSGVKTALDYAEEHWWIWVADVRKRRFYILDPYHKTCPSEVRMKLNKFVPKNVKREKYEWDNWTQEEVDHFRVEYASQILFHEMNQDRAEVISGSDTVRLSKPSSLLLSPYCQINSYDIDTD
ncbi:uncharacterized protein DS421_6g183410 [Arachis hypogaea]|nr:uncharacterized protein DS421_6g183410 [Arachis hypogaea]